MILRVPHCSLVKFSHCIIYLMAIERGLNPSEYEFTSPFGVSMTSTNGSRSIHSYVYIYDYNYNIYIYTYICNMYMYLYYIYIYTTSLVI